MALVEKYGPSLLRVAQLFVPSRAVAEEVVSETWLAVVTGLERFEERSTLQTWLFSILTNLLHFGCTIVGLDYGFKAQNGIDQVRGGAPYGATTIANNDGSRMPSEVDLDGARYLGKRVAETAAKLAA